jgi:hypothetical protein
MTEKEKEKIIYIVEIIDKKPNTNNESLLKVKKI